MSDWKTKMADILTAGRQPTIDDLEDALVSAVSERNALARELASALARNHACLSAVEDMAGWLGKMSQAFIRGDADKLAETMNDFIKHRVKSAMTKKGPVH